METTTHDLGWALNHVKGGGRAQRAGWNGKGMFIYLESCAVSRALDVVYGPALVMFTAQGTHQIGWLASQADLLAEDWVEA